MSGEEVRASPQFPVQSAQEGARFPCSGQRPVIQGKRIPWLRLLSKSKQYLPVEVEGLLQDIVGKRNSRLKCRHFRREFSSLQEVLLT
jgi:hypothetical protein